MAGTMVSAATGAASSLLAKLTTLMGEEYANLKGVRKEAESLAAEFDTIKAFLEKLDDMETLDPQAKEWRNQARDMSYDIEDCIDDFMHHLGKNDGTTSVVKKAINRLKKLKKRHQIAKKIQEIKIRVKDVSERRMRYWFDDCNPGPSSVEADPRVLAIYKEAAGLVGMDGPREELVKLLTGEEQELKVASVVGFGGLGKTTLANQVYCQIKGQFECSAIVSVSQKPDIPKILRRILIAINGPTSPHTSDFDDLNNIKEHLRNKRYFIIIDDLWDSSAWDVISCAFPENNNGSRVLTTTRIYSVAMSCCSSSKKYVYQMKPLNYEHSRRLFFGRIFGTQETCLNTFEDISADILRKCGGLPLAIISIASLLAGQSKSKWEYVRNSLGFLFEGNITLKGMEQILDLSYKHLPRHLKTCLLYLGIYPEDYDIERDDLVRRWVAEEFASNMHGQHAEDVARNYFNELINMSMIQPVDLDPYSPEVKYCRVHDIILDLIRVKCAEGNFIDIIDDPQAIVELQKKTRRVSLHYADAGGGVVPTTMNGSLPQVRSVVAIIRNFVPSFQGFKYVRVLSIETRLKEKMDLTGICGLFLLRYLKIKTRGMLELPNQLFGLQYLETMDFGTPVVLCIPSDIVRLHRLLHLIVTQGGVLQNAIDSLKSLRTLNNFDISSSSLACVKSLGELTNLRDLGLYSMKSDMEEGVKDALRFSLERLFRSNSLKSLKIGGVFDHPFCFSTSCQFPRHIQRLNLDGVCFPRIPKGMAQLHDLYRLELAVSEVVSKDDDIGILAGLPSLAYLHLRIEDQQEKVVIPGTGVAFPALRYLCFGFGRSTESILAFEAGAMRRLEVLALCLWWMLWEDVISWLKSAGIQHLLAGLKSVDIDCLLHSDDIRATKSAVRQVFNTHHPHVDLSLNWHRRCIQINLESLPTRKSKEGLAIVDVEASVTRDTAQVEQRLLCHGTEMN